jgi:hypothetical protein
MIGRRNVELKSASTARKVATKKSVKKKVGDGARRLSRDAQFRKKIIDEHEEAWKRLAKR